MKHTAKYLEALLDLNANSRAQHALALVQVTARMDNLSRLLKIIVDELRDSAAVPNQDLDSVSEILAGDLEIGAAMSQELLKVADGKDDGSRIIAGLKEVLKKYNADGDGDLPPLPEGLWN